MGVGGQGRWWGLAPNTAGQVQATIVPPDQQLWLGLGQAVGSEPHTSSWIQATIMALGRQQETMPYATSWVQATIVLQLGLRQVVGAEPHAAGEVQATGTWAAPAKPTCGVQH